MVRFLALCHASDRTVKRTADVRPAKHSRQPALLRRIKRNTATVADPDNDLKSFEGLSQLRLS